MRSRITGLSWWALLLLFSATAWSQDAGTQVRIPREAMFSSAEVEQLFAAGERLERERRWGEALLYYEEAVRKHPGQTDLAERLLLARMHYDVSRRYHDGSFVASVNGLSDRQALDLYMELLLKIHAHYVDQPDWNELVRRGAAAVEVALSEPAFVERNGIQLGEVQRAAFLYELNRPRSIRSRHDAREAVDYYSQLGTQAGLPATAVVLEYACAAATSLDDYSAFLTGDQLDDVMSQIEGNFVGLGIELKADNGALLIVDVIPGGPAHQGGMQAGDRIIEVDRNSTRDISTDAAADMLKGEEGSLVELVVESSTGLARRLQLRRTRVDVPSVEDVSIVDARYGVGYVRISSFQKSTTRDVDAALWQLHRQGMRSLLIDLRGNPGGLLNAAVEIADKFIASGSIVRTIGRSSAENNDFQAHAIGTWRVPLTVLIDGDSASASEIFAGAIRDHRRGTIVGEGSFGKGSVQGIFPLSIANVGVRLTTAKFYSPSGQAISHRGVQPDIVVQRTAKPVDGEVPAADDEDPVLDAGIHWARQQVSRG